jgi:hypothetical protein
MEMSQAERQELESIVGELCVDPWPDGLRTFDMGPELPEFTLFFDGHLSIVYRVVDNSVVEIAGIDQFDLGGALK